jgi:hypothetical protein
MSATDAMEVSSPVMAEAVKAKVSPFLKMFSKIHR